MGTPLSEEEKIRLAEEKNAIYRELLKQMSPKGLSREVKDTLDNLKVARLKLAIGSSSKNTKFILGQIGLGDYFDAISDGNNIMRSKPYPDVFQMAAKYLNIDPSKCLVVEDAKAGIDAAVAAGGMDSAAIGDAYGYARATYSIDSFKELLHVCNTFEL